MNTKSFSDEERQLRINYSKKIISKGALDAGLRSVSARKKAALTLVRLSYDVMMSNDKMHSVSAQLSDMRSNPDLAGFYTEFNELVEKNLKLTITGTSLYSDMENMMDTLKQAK